MMILELAKNQIVLHIISSAISLIIVLVCTLLLYALFYKKFENRRAKKNFRYRVLYIAILIYILILVRIWIAGFTHLFTMLSLIAAGLVVTNKESIMNIVGCLIINWRGLFSVGDFVEIVGYAGYVRSIKVLYFKIYEVESVESKKLTGKSIKIPNSVIISNPIALSPGENNIILKNITYSINSENSPLEARKLALEIITHIIREKYPKGLVFDNCFLVKKNNLLVSILKTEPVIHFKLSPDTEKKLFLQVKFYCYSDSLVEIEQEFLQLFLLKSKSLALGSNKAPLE